MKRFLGITALVAAAAIGLAGCASSASQPTEPPASSESSQSIDASKTLRVAFYSDPSSWDPITSPVDHQQTVLFMVYDRLIHTDEDGAPIPGIAESWEFTDEGLKLELRPGLTFHDGTPLDAEAVAANLLRSQSYERSTVRADLAAITGVDALSETEVLIRTDSTDLGLVQTLSGLSGTMVSPAAFDTEELALIGVGSGKYRMLNHEPNVAATLERFEDHWDEGAAAAAGIDLKFMTDPAARLNAVRSGELDMAWLDTDQISTARSMSDIGVVAATASMIRNIGFNPNNVPALQDPRARAALNHAIDREGIVEGVLFGEGKPAFQPYAPGNPNHVDMGVPYPYDPELAKELLAEAGYPDGFEFTVLAGTASSVDLESVQAQLAEVGITMNIEKVQGIAGPVRYWNDKTADALAGQLVAKPNVALTYEQYFFPGTRNPADLISPKANELLQEAKSTTDETVRNESLQELIREIVDTPINSLMIYYSNQGWAVGNDVVGLSVPTVGFTDFSGVGVTNRTSEPPGVLPRRLLPTQALAG